ncbi:NTP transferase domain-containing protein [Haloarculaceae archaeon H-GB2-1]|nr:NTP transferase domain-containing protein [Haloarculaceae archaeon H-GB11]MEA5410093.1 NTP transferase domain-containing protein [Haloarculaceae archaeon H-GB2-1]
MGPHTTDVPKAFLRIGGRTLYDRQRTVLDPSVDEVTVVLGYAYENVIDQVGDARTVIFEDWADYENAESLRRAIRGIDDDVFVLNGDIVTTRSVVERVVGRHRRTAPGRSVVAALPEIQEDDTALTCNERGLVTDYGMIRGYQHAGLGVIDASNLDAAADYLAAHPTEWYPGLYTQVPTEMVTIPATHHIEINSPRDMMDARDKLPFDREGELDAQT